MALLIVACAQRQRERERVCVCVCAWGAAESCKSPPPCLFVVLWSDSSRTFEQPSYRST